MDYRNKTPNNRDLSAVDFKAALQTKASALGFDLFGVTPAEPLSGSDFYAEWVALGYAGEMEYLKRNREKRNDPRQLVPGARSVICVGMHYYPDCPDKDSTPAASSKLEGSISVYARGDDYHKVVKSRLSDLWQFAQEKAGSDLRGRYYVDTAPILERELAQKAGLGWWGKNTCLINKWQGSYFFLGEIISDLVLSYDTPSVDHCGTCTRCLDACPTNAFPEPYVLDARRCISYLTIELKKSIPTDLRPDIGNWLFGCDICQEVCPWNSKAVTTKEPAFAERPELSKPDMKSLLELDSDGFNRLFKGNAIKRPKRRGFLRNVAVALGNSGETEAIAALIPALKHDEPLVRSHAAWALGQVGSAGVMEALREALETEEIEEVLNELNAAINNVAEN